MAWTSGFFNSMNGDRVYNAYQLSSIFEGLITDGVYESVGNKLAVQPNNGLAVQIATGRGWFAKHWVNNDSEHIMELTPSDVLLNRYVAVVVRADDTEAGRKAEPYLKYGDFNAAPQKPVLERTEFVKEFCLAYIYQKAGATEITDLDIEDTRMNTDLCGWVTGLIKQVDTKTLWDQWMAQWQQFLQLKERESEQFKTTNQQEIDRLIADTEQEFERLATEGDSWAQQAKTNAENSANSASSSAQSAARAESLVEEAYEIIKNSGNGGITDLLEVDLGYRFGELKQGNTGKNDTRDIVGVKDNSDKQVYYAVCGDSFLSRYKDGVWQDIALSYTHLIIEVVSLQKIATDGNRIYVLGYAINQNNSPVVFVIDNHDANSMDDIKTIAIETDEYSFGATVQPMIMDMTVNSYGDLILLTEYKTIQITPRDNTADSIVVVEDYYGNYGNMLTMEPLNSIAFDGNLNGVAVGRKHSSNEGYIRVYSDEIILNPYEEMIVGNAGFTKVIYCENCFLAFNAVGNVFKSEDGKDWGPIATLTDNNSQTPYNITDAAYNGQFVIALGINGELLVSDDLGYNWERLVNGQTEYRCLSESNGTFLLGKKEGGIDRYFIEIKALSLTETVKLLYLDYLERQNP